MTAPTRDEIVAALGGDHPFAIDFMDSVFDRLDPVADSDVALSRAGVQDDFTPPDDHPGTLWADLRGSEKESLHEAVYGTVHEVEELAGRILMERIVDRVEAWAKAHQDVPRGNWPHGLVKDPEDPATA